MRMSRFLTAYAVIAERSRDPTRLLDSKLFWILGLNRHYAFKAVHAILCCLNKELGLENTVLLQVRPARERASSLAPSAGWWGTLAATTPPTPAVCSATAAAGTSSAWRRPETSGRISRDRLQVHLQGGGSKVMEHTPVIMTTSRDITTARIGSDIRPELVESLRQTCVNIRLTHRLGAEFNKIEDTEIPACLKPWRSWAISPP